MDYFHLKSLDNKGQHQEFADAFESAKKNNFFELNQNEILELSYYYIISLESLKRLTEIENFLEFIRTKFIQDKRRKTLFFLLILEFLSFTFVLNLEKAERSRLQAENLVPYFVNINEEYIINWIGRFYFVKAIYFHRKGVNSETVEQLLKALTKFEISNNFVDKARTLVNLGAGYIIVGEGNKGLERLDKGLSIAETLNNRRIIAKGLTQKSIIFSDSGELVKAIEIAQKTLEVYSELKSVDRIANTLLNLGEIFEEKGDLNEALIHYQKSLDKFIEIDMKDLIGIASGKMGNIYRLKGNKKQAEDYYLQSLNIFETEKTQDQYVTSYKHIPFFGLILLFLEQNDLEKAKDYLEKFRSLHETHSHYETASYYRLAEILVLKNDDRLVKKVKAQKLLSELVNEPVKLFEVTAIGLAHLCELLLLEYSLYENKDVLNEINLLLEKLHKLGKKSHSFVLTINTLIIQAKIAVIGENLNKALDFLDNAEKIAVKNELTFLKEQVIKEKQKIDEDFDKMKILIARNATFEEKSKEMKLREYIKRAQDIIK